MITHGVVDLNNLAAPHGCSIIFQFHQLVEVSDVQLKLVVRQRRLSDVQMLTVNRR